jgi:endo-1,4-beta-xylanase
VKVRHLVVLAAAGGAFIASPAAAAPRSAPDSLRAPAARIGLRVGVAVNPFDLDTPAYRRVVRQQFSSVTPENEMKWEVVEPRRGEYDWSAADRLVRFARRNSQRVRGHVLLWHNQLPAWLTTGVQDGTIDNDQLRRILHRHITRQVRHFRGRIWQWDVANEFFTDANPSTINPDDFWVSHLGAGIIADAFRWAHAADPRALLFYNDYNIAGEDGSNAKSDAVYAWVQQLRDQGVPIDGVGDQGHLDIQYGFPTRMAEDLQRYADLGLKVAITEADVRTFVHDAARQVPTDDLATLAQPYAFSQMLKVCLAVRACISFTVWGVSDAVSWVPTWFTDPLQGYATLYDVDLNPKPAYTALQQDLQLAAHGAPRRVPTR